MSLPRILFVDDEEQILVALERALRRHRHELATVFACGSDAGLAALAEGSFDVVFSDMRMPRRDGIMVLGAVREQQPAALRVVLSGQTDRDMSLRSADVGHRFLSKPSSTDDIRNVVARCAALQRRVPDPALRAAIGRVGALPVLARVRDDLLAALARQAPPRELAAIAAGDAGLCAKLLQLVNAGFFGRARRYVAVHEAIASIGSEQLHKLVASLRAIDGAAAEERRRRAARVAATAARVIGEPALVEDAYTAGLLFDLGVHVLDGAGAGDRRARAAAGAYLIDAWGLPETIVDAVGGGEGSVAAAVRLADQMVADRDRGQAWATA
jgi:DNA-binding NarL/FixJ family response regulator